MTPCVSEVWDLTVLPWSPCRLDWRSLCVCCPTAAFSNCSHTMNNTPELSLETDRFTACEQIALEESNYFASGSELCTYFFSLLKSRLFGMRCPNTSGIYKPILSPKVAQLTTIFWLSIKGIIMLSLTMVSRADLREEESSWCSGSRLISTLTSNKSSDWTDEMTSEWMLYVIIICKNET